MVHEINVKNSTPTWALVGSVTGYTGMWIRIGNVDITLNSVTKYNLVTATTCYVGTTVGGSEVGSQAFSSNVATFGTPLTLSANTIYYITNGSGGANYNGYYDDTDEATEYKQPNLFKWGGRIDQLGNVTDNNIGGGIISANFDGYYLERSSGRLNLGKGIWNKRKSNIFSKQTAEGEVRVKTESGETTQIIETPSSYNSSVTEVTIASTTYSNIITVSHKSKTGKVVVMATAPLVVQTSNGDVTLRLTKSGVEIGGSEKADVWSSGDGQVSVSLMAFEDVEIGKTKTYAFQWKQGQAELDFVTGGTFGAYNIFVQDIQ